MAVLLFITGNSLPSKILPNLTTLKNEAKNVENIASSGMKIRGISSLSTENDTTFKGKNENTDAGRKLQSSIPLFQSSLKNEEKNKGNAINDWAKFRRLYSYDVENETNSMEILEINEGDSLSSGIPSIHTPLGTEVSKGAIMARLEITIRGIHFGNKHNHSGEESIEEPNSSVDCSSEAVIIVAALGSLFFFRKRPSVGIKATSSSSSISQV
ncbi:hypothetical protein C0J52_07897 [Blattella germanica]|nr:hypothetical protein C0J52_07897 [Blattella germanica]